MKFWFIQGAIFMLFIFCIHYVTAEDLNEITIIYVPSPPKNLTLKEVTADRIHLSWVPPTTFKQLAFPKNSFRKHVPLGDQAQVETTTSIMDKINPEQADAPIDLDHLENYKPVNNVETKNSVPQGSHLEKNLPSPDWYIDDSKRNKDHDEFVDRLGDLEHIFRGKREIVHSQHRHRKRRQETTTETPRTETPTSEENIIAPKEIIEKPIIKPMEKPIEVVKKSYPPTAKNSTQVAYVLYIEEGNLKSNASILSIPSSEEVKNISIFANSSIATKNYTLVNKAGIYSPVVAFSLKNLKSLTPYKIWIRAFYNISLEGVKSSDLLDRLGPNSEFLYVVTDVKPPSSPIILKLTCDQPNGILYLQWRQPLFFENTLDQYVITIRRIPDLNPRTKMTIPTNKLDIETTISVSVELVNLTRYEVKMFAVTRSVAKKDLLINGAESPPQEVSSDWCTAHPEARAPEPRPEQQPPVATLALLSGMLLALLFALLIILVYWRGRVSKCLSAAYTYLEEGGDRSARDLHNQYKKPVGVCSPLRACGAGEAAEAAPAPAGPARPPRMSSAQFPAIGARLFPRHVAALHADGDIGFSKEYEVVVARSAALGHTSHHSHRPENRHKNRYLNITAYDHSRVCVAGGEADGGHGGGWCGAAGCAAGTHCDYVNANFIDGMLPSLNSLQKLHIKKKLEKRNKPQRQPSVKRAVKVPPNLAEGIESAFLNIEFSGIVEPEEQRHDDSGSDASDDDDSLDDVYVDLDGVSTRVKLEWLVWRRRYIATQGPTPATLHSFWRMIWQHRVHTLVMITNLVERGRRKCDMYWPGGGRGSTAEYGGVHVTLLHEDVRAAFTVRHLRVTAQLSEIGSGSGGGSGSGSGGGGVSGSEGESESEARTIVQYHYTVWPDHGTPQHPLAVLPFVKAASADPHTVLVHCSAGVGRTGTYIVLDAQLSQLKLTGTLAPLGFLCRARTQRNHLVQTEEQYIFVHDSLLEHVRSGDTAVHFDKAKQYLVKLLEPISQEELMVMEFPNKKNQSTFDLTAEPITNGYMNGDSTPDSKEDVNSTQCEDSKHDSNVSDDSVKTDDDLGSDRSKTESVKDVNGVDGSSTDEKDMNGGEGEGVYDLAPKSTNTYSKKMQEYANMTEQEKEECRRANRAENFALLERMRSLASKNTQLQGPPPVNLLEKQYQLIMRSSGEPGVCARSPHNADKNRPGGVVPTDLARVMLVPKPGVEGSEYVNASWVCGRRRQREFAATQHPPAPAAPDLWRLLWDHTAQLLLVLTDLEDPECEVFWPTEEEPELFAANFRATFVSKETYVAHRKCDRPPAPPAQSESPSCYRRQESTECADDERLIPENSSPISSEGETPPLKKDRVELRLERLGSGSRDLSTRKSIANGDLFSSTRGPKSPKSPSKMSLKSFKLSSPTKFKFPDWSKGAGPPPDTAPPPIPVTPPATVEEEMESRRPCYYFELVDKVPSDVSPDRVIEVINVSVHSLQDDYQLNIKVILCSKWLENDVSYFTGHPDDNPLIKEIREAKSESEKYEAVDRLTEPFADTFALVEFVGGLQMEYKNGPVVVVDKYGGWRALSLCVLSASCGGTRDLPQYRVAGDEAADVYCWAALSAQARAHTSAKAAPLSPAALLAQYCALERYARLLLREPPPHS